MSANRLERLIAEAESATTPATVPLTQVHRGRTVSAYLRNGAVLWHCAEDGPAPDGAVKLYVEAS